ncbi:MAG: ArsR family transcriptional regulator [archaeon]
MKKVTKWEDVSFIISSDYRKKVLSNLENQRMPFSISKKLNINKTHISRALKELEGKKMLLCLTPNSNKGKLFVISEYGKKILEEIKKL